MLLNYKYGAVGLCFLGMTGCMNLNPEYSQPTSPVATSFNNQAVGGSSSQPVADIQWRTIFLDTRLQKVIAMSLDNNRDLRMAMLNIDKARAQYRIQKADLYPSVSASVSQSASKAQSSSGQSQISRSSEFSVGFTSWELDLFGRIRSLNTESLESYFATAETQRSSRMSLVAEVASDWLTIAAYQQQLRIAESTLASQEKTLKLTYAKYKEGISSALDYEEIKTSVDSAKADIASYKKALAQAQNALNLIVGTAVPAEFLPSNDIDLQSIRLAPIAENLSSSMLQNHPDVLYVEHLLKGANADIGAARAAFFPTISLTTTAGRSSSDLEKLFSAGTGTWSFIPTISVPIFQGGELKASLDSAKIQKNIYIAQYEKAIQTAFSDVADALAVRQNIEAQLDAQKDLVRSSERSYRLSTARYKEGLDSYLTALTAQRTYYSAQQELVTLVLEEATNRVTLYKVLGGGADAQ
ncbi:efflux transporter outer membrane subunit [Acinetobacter sp. UBA6720]|uniref:efflux transporter outer membrane subunit n=1 Tax=Acinetobacter sp. UBA6720 TaxID=1945953 RepID=UPI0025BCDFAF|nr:efflux transporter outer membrane subunit [Acinetobacter sp. UBA6720]